MKVWTRLHHHAPKRNRAVKKSESGIICLRLLNRADCVLLFLHDLTVPFTNNEAERKDDQGTAKSLGMFPEVQGLKDFCTLRSIIETARKQG